MARGQTVVLAHPLDPAEHSVRALKPSTTDQVSTAGFGQPNTSCEQEHDEHGGSERHRKDGTATMRDRVGEGSERIRFLSPILPPYARRSKASKC